MKSKIAKPEVKVIMFQALNVISTSGDTNYTKSFGLEGLTNHGTDWQSSGTEAKSRSMQEWMNEMANK